MNSISLLGADTLDESVQFALDEAVSNARSFLSTIKMKEPFSQHWFRVKRLMKHSYSY